MIKKKEKDTTVRHNKEVVKKVKAYCIETGEPMGVFYDNLAIQKLGLKLKLSTKPR